MKYICDYLGENAVLYDVSSNSFSHKPISELSKECIDESKKEREKLLLKLELADNLDISKYRKGVRVNNTDYYHVRTSCYVKDLVKIDGVDCNIIITNFYIRRSRNRGCYYYIIAEMFFYNVGDDFIPDDYLYHLVLTRNCPFELLYSFGIEYDSTNFDEQSFLDLYSSYLGNGNFKNIVKLVLQNGVFNENYSIKRKDCNEIVGLDSSIESMLQTNRVDFNPNGIYSDFGITLASIYRTDMLLDIDSLFE